MDSRKVHSIHQGTQLLQVFSKYFRYSVYCSHVRLVCNITPKRNVTCKKQPYYNLLELFVLINLYSNELQIYYDYVIYINYCNKVTQIA